jgi:hypothetical protein
MGFRVGGDGEEDDVVGCNSMFLFRLWDDDAAAAAADDDDDDDAAVLVRKLPNTLGIIADLAFLVLFVLFILLFVILL